MQRTRVHYLKVRFTHIAMRIYIYRYGVLDGLCARGICFVLVSGRGTIGHCSAYDSSWLSGE